MDKPTTTTVKPNRRAETDTYELFNIVVGHEPFIKTFTIRKPLLCATSPFFATAMKPGTFRESVENTVRLPEHDPAIFEAYSHLIQHHSIDVSTIPGKPRGKSLMHLYILAEYLGDVLCKNAVVESFLRECVHGYLPDEEDVKAIYKECEPGVGLRRCVVDVRAFGFAGGLPGFQQPLDGFLNEFRVELLAVLRQLAGLPLAFTIEVLSAEDYYEMGDGERS